MLRVYQACLGSRLSPELERAYLARMPESICRVIQRYLRWEDRQSRLFAKLLLQHALSRAAPDSAPSCLDMLEYSEYGKPLIKGEKSFNISHSGDVVVLALADDGYVGIDVEKIRPISLSDFYRYVPEVSSFESRDPVERLNLFYSCWTSKEAVLKGVGCGLQASPEQVSLKGDTACFRGQVWYLQAIDCGTEYCCTIATSINHAACCIEVVNFRKGVRYE